MRATLDPATLNGEVTREIMVYSNDPKTGVLEIELSGVVVPCYQVTPSTIRLDLSQGQKEGTAEILLMMGLRAPLSQVTTSDDRISATIIPGDDGSYELEVKVRGSFPRGSSSVGLTVKSGDPSDPVCQVPVFIRNPGDLELLPEKLRFLPGSEPQTAFLWVKQHGAAPLVLLDAVPPSGNFHCEIDPVPSSDDYMIYLSVEGQRDRAVNAGVLMLKMRDQNNKELSVPVPVTIN